MRPALEAEKLGIPSVVITLTGFTEVAHLAAKATGIENLRIAEYPGAVGVHLDKEIPEKVEKVLFGQIIDGLTKMQKSEKSDTSNTGWNAKEVVFKGTFEEVNHFFRVNGWSDGLPVVPPAVEKVESFLKYTNRSPDEQIAILPQANLRATARNIAANAIMAGCRPQDMPILIAAVEAIGDEHYNLNNIGTTWGVLPFLFVNGPIIKQLKMEYGGKLISGGPNPAIGRALGLIVRNIAGYSQEKNYMGTFGYPLVFAFAENEEENPWEPYHVEHGFDRNSSTVTTGATVTWGWPPSPYDTPDQHPAQSAIGLLSRDLTKRPCIARLVERGPDGFRNMITLLLAPPVAKALADGGFSKQSIKEYLYENARVPLHELDWWTKYGHPELLSVKEKVGLGTLPNEYLVGPNDMVRVLPSPDIVHIVVCGDPDRNRFMTLWSGYVQPVTKEIKLPQNWDELLKEASN